MRKIKFRGKTVSGRWVYGDLLHITNADGISGTIIVKENQATAQGTDYDNALSYAHNEIDVVIPDTIGQYTGLLDINDKEIYEGDIVREKLKRARIDGDILQICFEDYEWCGKNNYGATTSYSLLATYHKLEVIGNIHETPELPKGGNDEE